MSVTLPSSLLKSCRLGLPKMPMPLTLLNRKSRSSRLPTLSAPTTSVRTARKASVFFSNFSGMGIPDVTAFTSARNLRDLQGHRNGAGRGATPGGDRSERERRLEDFHRLADDPDAVELGLRELELDVDAAGAMHVVSLRAGELRRGTRVRQQALLGEIGA